MTIRVARRPPRWKGMIAGAWGGAAALAALILSVRVLQGGAHGLAPASAAAETPQAWTMDSNVTTDRTTSTPEPIQPASDGTATSASMPAPGSAPAAPTARPRAAVPSSAETKVVANAMLENDPPTAGAEQNSPFDTDAARRMLEDAAGRLADCSLPEVGPGTARIAVTFAPTGRATTAVLEAPGPFGGTPVVACIVNHLRAVQVPPFGGASVTIHRSVTVP